MRQIQSDIEFYKAEKIVEEVVTINSKVVDITFTFNSGRNESRENIWL